MGIIEVDTTIIIITISSLVGWDVAWNAICSGAHWLDLPGRAPLVVDTMVLAIDAVVAEPFLY
jgi:hypothetical protein